MYLSNRDIKWAIECGRLIVNPPPETFDADYDETSIDLHLASVAEAQVWDVEAYKAARSVDGIKAPELAIGAFKYEDFGGKYLTDPPDESTDPAEAEKQLVCLRGKQVIVKPGGFLLWQTKEEIGTPIENPSFICFVNAKSTKARTGIIVHFTAPTIHAGWNGSITLEIANHGPFHFILQENDSIAQLTVAQISTTPDLTLKKKKSQTAFQVIYRDVASAKKKKPAKPKSGRR